MARRSASSWPTDAAPAFVETQAGAFVPEAAELQQAPGLSFRVGHQFLVHEVVDMPRMPRMPEAHHAVVIAPAGRDVLEVVRERLRRHEQVLVDRPRRLERVAPAVDEPRAGQHRADRAELQPAGQRLVGRFRLVLAPARGAVRVPATAAALLRWQTRVDQADLDPAVAALGAVQALPGVQACVVGVENFAQWQDIRRAWSQAQPLDWPDLASADPRAYDPRMWPKQ